MEIFKVYNEYKIPNNCQSGYFKSCDFINNLLNNSLIYVLAKVCNGKQVRVLHTSQEKDILNWAEKINYKQRIKNLPEFKFVVNVVDDKFKECYLEYADFKKIILEFNELEKERG